MNKAAKRISAIAALGFYTAASLALIPHENALADSTSLSRDPSVCNGISVVPGTTPVSCNTYPSLVEYTGQSKDGTVVTLRCAWQPSLIGPVVDNRYREITIRNDQKGTAKRIETLYSILIATKNLSPMGESTTFKAELEAFTRAKSIAAKICTIEPNNDVLSDCQQTPSFVDRASTADYDAQMGENCALYVERLTIGGSITNEDYNLIKARQWYQKQQRYLDKLTQ